MMRLATCVRVTGEDGGMVVLTPADDVPAWAVSQIKNPAAWADAPAAVGVVEDDSTGEDVEVVQDETVPATDDARPDYAGMKVADLRDLIEARNEGRDEEDLIPTDGVKADLVAALEADDSA